MQRARSSILHFEILAQRIDVGRALRVFVTGVMVVAATLGLALAVLVGAGVAPVFDQSIALDAHHHVVIHYGESPTCESAPNPPQHDCWRPGLQRREFSVDYLTPSGAKSLLRLRLPSR